MLETSTRLLQLLMLLQARRYWTGASLAERLEVTPRTVRRDIDRLRSLGYPVQATPGIAGGYQLGPGTSLPPLLLEDDEALAVAIGLRTASSGNVAGIEESALRALSKLEQVLPARLRRRVNALNAHIVPLGPAATGVDSRILSAIAGACRDQERLLFGYSGARGSSSPRHVEPYGLVHAGRRWYFVAWDLEREDFRTFRVDRIEPPIRSGARFIPRPPPDADLGAFVSRSVSLSVYRFRARVLLHAPIEQMRERVSPSSGVLERVDAKRCRLLTGTHSVDSLALWIGLIDVDFDIESPPELVERVQKLGRRLLRATRTGSGRPHDGV